MSRAQEASGSDIIRIFFVIGADDEVCHLIGVNSVPDPVLPQDDDDEG
jgi:hypothetical protein